MTTFAHVGGRLVPAAEASVNVRDRGFRYGDAAFETLRAYNGTILRWHHHWRRLERTCEGMRLPTGVHRTAARARIRETMAANGLADAYIRLSISRGVQTGRLAPQQHGDPTVVIIVEPLPRGGTTGQRTWDGPATCAIPRTRHIPDESLPAHLKTHNYLVGILAKAEAMDRGADEAVLLDTHGRLTEGTVSNVFFVRDGELCTPSTATQPVLPGITREIVLEIAEDAGIPTLRDSFAPEALFDADEAFLTNRTWELRPIGRVDETELSVGRVTSRLQAAYDELVERTCY